MTKTFWYTDYRIELKLLKFWATEEDIYFFKTPTAKGTEIPYLEFLATKESNI